MMIIAGTSGRIGFDSATDAEKRILYGYLLDGDEIWRDL